MTMQRFTQNELEVFDIVTSATLFDDDADVIMDGIMVMLETDEDRNKFLFFINSIKCENIDGKHLLDCAIFIKNRRFD